MMEEREWRSGRMPVASVIVAAYNCSSSLRECIGALQQQTCKDIEIIVVDDGSTDDTAAVAESISDADARIRIVRQSNAGPGIARNTGIAHACGDVLFFCDSDDYFEPTCVEAGLAAIERTGADMAAFAYYRTDERVGERVPAWWGLRRDLFPGETVSWRDNPDWAFEAFRSIAWNKAFRRSFVEQFGIRFHALYQFEDAMFTLPAVVLADRIACVDQLLLTHREGTGASITSFKDKHPFDVIEAFSALKAFLEDTDLMDDLRISYANWTANALAYFLHTFNEPDSFRKLWDTLAKGAARDLGLFDIPLSAYVQGERSILVEMLQKDDREGYLFGLFRRIFEGRQEALYQVELAREHADDLKDTTIWKVGSALTVLPRKFKDALMR